MTHPISRRTFLLTAGGVGTAVGLAATATAQPTRGNAAAMEAAIKKIVGAAQVTAGKVKLDLPPLSENGNTVPLSVSVESPMTAEDHVKAIHLFTERNPQPDVASFFLGPRSGRASVSTRIRLADTQNVVAIAELSNGSFWSARVPVVVTLAACLEE